jgi:hypothetical protein
LGEGETGKSCGGDVKSDGKLVCVERENGGGCQTSCGNSDQYEVDKNGICVVKKCGGSCSNTFHYMCVEKSCDNRTVKTILENGEKACGNGQCYVVNITKEDNSFEEKCNVSCLNKRFLIYFQFRKRFYIIYLL